METKNPEATQPPLTPESANPPQEPQKKNPAAGKYNVIPDEILPAEDKPFQTMEERRKERRESVLRNGT